ncbi:Fungal specific transcription factor domain [Ceratobasidium sp. AG-Ba]|nr:Fungal specific transcription factor domain [Ceratobasidium sp. AG-Ba]
MSPARVFLATFLGLVHGALAWTIPNINLPTFTYQCMPMELRWRDGSAPYMIWFDPADSPPGTNPDPGYAVWRNLTGENYLVPCKAPAGKVDFEASFERFDRVDIYNSDYLGSTGVGLAGSFVVLPSSDSSCLGTSNDVGLSQSQSILSMIVTSFQQSVISAISVSATAIAATTAPGESGAITSASAATETASSSSSKPNGTKLAQIIGPVLGCFVGILLGISFSVCYLRKKRRKRQSQTEPHIPLSSTSAFDLFAGESERGVGSGRQHSLAASMTEPNALPPAEPTAVPRSRLQLHDGSTLERSEKRRTNTHSQSNPSRDLTLVDEAATTETSEPSQPRPSQPATRDQNLELRAEELSAPELERLAALVARRLERVRGAPPQYQPTEDV